MAQESINSQISAKELYELFIKNNVSYFCGVPDTSLSSFGFYIQEHAPSSHDVAINEGNAVGQAIGHYIATSEVPLVYMQNSGLGNAINPLASLADPEIMGIPMILVVGWRGQPGKNDEPQHKKQGQITIPLLDTLGISHTTLSRNFAEAAKQIHNAIKGAVNSSQPYAIVIETHTIKPYKKPTLYQAGYPLSREEVIEYVVNSLDNSDAVIATTGKASRELYELRDKKQHGHERDLLIVGGMGHASAIALKIAEQKPNKKIYCIDGDGAVLMHMGTLAVTGISKLENFYHVVINNGSHESVGGQQTIGFDINMTDVAKACGYAHTYLVFEADAIKDTLRVIRKQKGPIFLEIRVNTQSRDNLSRPNAHPQQNKKSFMSFLDEE